MWFVKELSHPEGNGRRVRPEFEHHAVRDSLERRWSRVVRDVKGGVTREEDGEKVGIIYAIDWVAMGGGRSYVDSVVFSFSYIPS